MKKTIIFTILTLTLLASCQYIGNGDMASVDMKNEPVVTAMGQTLYRSDLERAIPSSLIGEDSIKAAKEYIRVWTNDLVFYDRAKRNITNPDEINRLVDQYKKDIVTNAYRESILKEHLNKSTTEAQLKRYYENNQHLFRLESPIIKGLYIKVPANSPALENFRKWYKLNSDEGIHNIENEALQNAVNYESFYDRWVNLHDLLTNMPYIIENDEQFLKTKDHLEVSDSSYVYLLGIREYMLAGEQTPYNYIKEKLPEIYKEENRGPYIKRIQDDLYKEAIKNKKIIYY